jgi:hypothetical protein
VGALPVAVTRESGFDDDLAGEATRIANRIRGQLTSVHPAWTRNSPTRS